MLLDIPKAAVSPWQIYRNALFAFDPQAFERTSRFMESFCSGDLGAWPPEHAENPVDVELHKVIGLHYESQAGFALSSALASLAPSVEVMLLVDEWGIPHHSCVSNPLTGLTLDASGIKTREKFLDYWSTKPEMARSSLALRSVVVDELWFYGRFDDKNPQDVLSDFGRLLQSASCDCHQLAVARVA